MQTLSKISPNFSQTDFFSRKVLPPLIDPMEPKFSLHKLLQTMYPQSQIKELHPDFFLNLKSNSNSIGLRLNKILDDLTEIIYQKYNSDFSIIKELYFVKFDFLMGLFLRLGLLDENLDLRNLVIDIVSYMSGNFSKNYDRVDKLGLIDLVCQSFVDCDIQKSFNMRAIFILFRNTVVTNHFVVERYLKKGVYRKIVEDIELMAFDPDLVLEIMVFLVYSGKLVFILKNYNFNL